MKRLLAISSAVLLVLAAPAFAQTTTSPTPNAPQSAPQGGNPSSDGSDALAQDQGQGGGLGGIGTGGLVMGGVVLGGAAMIGVIASQNKNNGNPASP